MTFLIFILAALATYRLSVMITKESGPGNIFGRLRQLPDPEKNAGTYEGLRCLWCVSVWMAAFITTGLISNGRVPMSIAFVYWLAVSTGAIIIDAIVTSAGSRNE